MTDPITIITLVVSASNIIIIPIIIKSLDILFYIAKHIKNSKCCCFNLEMEPEIEIINNQSISEGEIKNLIIKD